MVTENATFIINPPGVARVGLAKYREGMHMGRTLEEHGYAKLELIAEGSFLGGGDGSICF